MYLPMKEKLVISTLAIAVLMLAVPAVLSAAVTVDNISLKKQGEFTDLTVYVSDATDFDHSIVEPGAGKPYRIVLDIKNARHMLPHYNFNDLPSQTITSIRTSQYSINPEKVVRVVIDVKGHVTYKVNESKSTITLVMATPNDAEFPFWCAQPLSEAEKIQLALSENGEAPTTNPSGEETTPVLVSSKVSGSPDAGPKIPSKTEKPAAKQTETTKKQKHDEPVMANNVIKGLPKTELPSAASQTPQASTPELEKKTPVVMPQQTPAWQPPAEPLVLLAQNDDTTPAAKDDKPAETPTPKVFDSKSVSPKQTGFTDSAANTEPRTPGMKQDDGPGNSSPAVPGPSTSPTNGKSNKDMFRMNPDDPTKTKGTLADRFPKRKIIEYSSWGTRDPFAQLVDRGHSHEPGEMPDVETLRLVGVLQGDGGSSALLEDVEGFGYILRDGDPVRNGYVVQIGEKKIIFQIQEYGWSRTVALKIETEN